jgi:glycosyltransferase involved in cell wall biosynthesis
MQMAMKPRIALVTGWTNPERRSIVEIALNLLNTLQPFSSSLTWLVTNLNNGVHLNNNINLMRIKSKYIARDESAINIIPLMMLYQFKIIRAIFKLLPKVDVFVFAQGSDLSFLPMLLIRLARKRVILRSDGRPSVLVEKYIKGQSKVKVWLLRLIETLSYLMAERILPETGNLVDLYRMYKYQDKISIGSQYVDISAFKETKKLSERQYDVGYIGRLIPEKGALAFAKALPLILKDKSSQCIIIGDGHLRNEIEQVVIDNNIQSQVKSLDWVENKMLPHYLNDIKLVVVPSDYEGLSNLMLEAMACGTLVLATPVGGTPGIVREGETGFVLENNSSECIAKNVFRVLNSTDLDRIRDNAHAQINETYSYPAAVARYRNIFKSLGFEVENSPNPGITRIITETHVAPDPEQG